MPKAKTTKKTELYDENNQKYTLVTEEGLKKLKDELEFLQTEKRHQVAERLKEAISYGDLSENSEYEEAKNEQAFVEGRIIELGEKIKNAKIITEKKGASKTVEIGSTVELTNITKDIKEKYTIVGSTEADPFNNKISNESPIGGALLERKKGDTVKVTVPGGLVEYKIDKIA